MNEIVSRLNRHADVVCNLFCTLYIEKQLMNHVKSVHIDIFIQNCSHHKIIQNCIQFCATIKLYQILKVFHTLFIIKNHMEIFIRSIVYHFLKFIETTVMEKNKMIPSIEKNAYIDMVCTLIPPCAMNNEYIMHEHITIEKRPIQNTHNV